VHGRIAYVGFDSETGDTDLYTMNSNGTGIACITTDGQSKGNPQWSPGGTRIACDASANSDAGSCCSLNICTVNADGTDRRRLTDTLDTGVGRNVGATWAPIPAHGSRSSARAARTEASRATRKSIG
jgi:Tol biopolymer transport system component